MKHQVHVSENIPVNCAWLSPDGKQNNNKLASRLTLYQSVNNWGRLFYPNPCHVDRWFLKFRGFQLAGPLRLRVSLFFGQLKSNASKMSQLSSLPSLHLHFDILSVIMMKCVFTRHSHQAWGFTVSIHWTRCLPWWIDRHHSTVKLNAKGRWCTKICLLLIKYATDERVHWCLSICSLLHLVNLLACELVVKQKCLQKTPRCILYSSQVYSVLANTSVLHVNVPASVVCVYERFYAQFNSRERGLWGVIICWLHQQIIDISASWWPASSALSLFPRQAEGIFLSPWESIHYLRSQNLAGRYSFGGFWATACHYSRIYIKNSFFVLAWRAQAITSTKPMRRAQES